MSRSHILVLILTMLAIPSTTFAGQYVAGTTTGLVMSEIGSGGGWIVTPGAGSITGGAGGGAGVPGSSASAAGTISTTFTWQRNLIDGGEEDSHDNPPANAVIVESCAVDSTAAQYGGSCDVSADCGLRTPYNPGGPIPTGGFTNITPVYLDDTNQVIIGYQFDCNSSASQPRIVAGNESITVNYDLVSASAYSTDGPYNIQVTYSASVSPVVISVTGTVEDSDGTIYAEAGRKNVGNVSTTAPNTILSNWQWNVGGADAFKSYEHDSIGLLTNLTSSDLTNVESPYWYWKIGTPEEVTVEANVLYNGVNIGTVSADELVVVEAPQFVYMNPATSNLSEIFVALPCGLGSAGDPTFKNVGGEPEGIIYYYGGYSCPHFPFGKVYTAQLVDEQWDFYGVFHLQSSTGGSYELDSSYPFRTQVLTVNSDYSGPSTTQDYDAPSYTDAESGTVVVSTSYRIYFMYQSSDRNEQDIPLNVQDWDWTGNSAGSPPISPSLDADVTTSQHPQWTATL